VYISKDRAFFLAGVFDMNPQRRSYHISFKNVCGLLTQKGSEDALLVFICLLRGGENAETMEGTQRRVKAILQETTGRSFSSTFLNLASLARPVPAFLSKLHSSFMLLSIYDKNFWVTDLIANVMPALAVKKWLEALEEASFASFFLPKYVPHLQSVLAIVELMTSMASNLTSLWIRRKSSLTQSNTCKGVFLISLVLLLLVPLLTLFFLTGTPVFGSVMSFLRSHVLLLPALQLMNLFFMDFPGFSKGWEALGTWFVERLGGICINFFKMQIPSDFILFVNNVILKQCWKSLQDGRKTLSSAIKFFQCLHKGILNYFNTLNVAHHTGIFSTLGHFQDQIENISKSHFTEREGGLNVQLLADKKQILHVLFSLFQMLNDMISLGTETVLQTICPTVALLNPSAAGGREHGPIREIFDVMPP
jgi:hypothetical protein